MEGHRVVPLFFPRGKDSCILADAHCCHESPYTACRGCRSGKSLHRTPCLDVLESCEGIYLTDIRGKRYMDFHGNNVHQLGYRNPYLVEKIKAQLDVLPFSPRRFTNLPAIELAQALGRL